MFITKCVYQNFYNKMFGTINVENKMFKTKCLQQNVYNEMFIIKCV